MKPLKLFLIILGWLTYWLFGSYLFLLIEKTFRKKNLGPDDKTDINFAEYYIKKIVDGKDENLAQIKRNYSAYLIGQYELKDDAKTSAFINDFITQFEDGAKEKITKNLKLDYSLSLFYTTTILTTIGYGNVLPLSEWGMLFTTIYALMGIPLTLAVVALLGIRIKSFCEIIAMKINIFSDPKIDAISDTIIILTFFVSLFILLPTCLFVYTEKWSFLESFYFVIITMTTIGLGDYVATWNSRDSWSHMWIFSIWAYLALIFGAAFFSSVQSKLVEEVEYEQFDSENSGDHVPIIDID